METIEQVIKAKYDARRAASKAADADAAAAEATTTEVKEAAKPIAFKALSTDEFGVITLIAGAAGSPTKLDKDNEFLEKADLVKMAFDFCSDTGRTFKANHQEPIDCSLVESFVGAPIVKDGDATRTLKADEVLAEDAVVVGINIEKGNESHWFVTVKPKNAEVVELAKAGGIAGASWSGLCTKTEV